MDKTNVIIKPLVTEKTTHQQATRNSYAFKVRSTATKPQIKHAVESMYEVKVLQVRTMVRKGKPRKSRHKIIHTGKWKRAVVVLAEESRIEIF